jgi:GTP-binding protein
MNDFLIKQAVFKTSVGLGGEYPERSAAEIAIVGKSNIGKSSLINSLCNNYRLAHTSQTPGKTRLINFFLINDHFYLVDLPGYGFAQASKSEKKSWGELIEGYLSSGRLTHIFLLLDIRNGPSGEDKRMYEWIVYYGVPYTLIATKADKLARSKRQQAADLCAKQLGSLPYAIAYSSENADGRHELLQRIGHIIRDAEGNSEGQQTT